MRTILREVVEVRYKLLCDKLRLDGTREARHILCCRPPDLQRRTQGLTGLLCVRCVNLSRCASRPRLRSCALWVSCGAPKLLCVALTPGKLWVFLCASHFSVCPACAGARSGAVLMPHLRPSRVL